LVYTTRLKKLAFEQCSVVLLQLGEHGFPSKPSSLAYDPKLKLLAIGTKTGAVRMYLLPMRYWQYLMKYMLPGENVLRKMICLVIL